MSASPPDNDLTDRPTDRDRDRTPSLLFRFITCIANEARSPTATVPCLRSFHFITTPIPVVSVVTNSLSDSLIRSLINFTVHNLTLPRLRLNIPISNSVAITDIQSISNYAEPRARAAHLSAAKYHAPHPTPSGAVDRVASRVASDASRPPMRS